MTVQGFSLSSSRCPPRESAVRTQDMRAILKKKCVGIAGCGGLGSNAAVSLARVGVGTLVVTDFDTIEESNLDRQYYFHDQIGLHKATALKDIIGRIDSSIRVVAHVVELNPKNIPELFSRCDLMLEAFDRAEMKEMIIQTVLAELSGKPIIAGVGLAGCGRNELITTSAHGTLYIVGDRTSEASDENPSLAPRVGLVANMMANLALELLLGQRTVK
jgi:sulfur carrier protein ThiS adenylyltransferase